MAKIKGKFDSLGYRALFYTLLFWPLWWILGIDQIFPPVMVILVGTGIIVSSRGKFSISLPARVLFIFLLVQLISATQIGTLGRLLAFGLRWGYWLSIFFLFIYIENARIPERNLRKLVYTGLMIVILQAVIGVVSIILYTINGGYFTFIAPLGKAIVQLLPPDPYLETVFVVREIGRIGSFFSYKYLRLLGFETLPTLYSMVLALSVPLVVYFFSKGKWRVMLLGLIFINLIFTTSRTSLLVLLSGSLIFYLFVIRTSRNKKQLLLLSSTMIAIVGFVLVITNLSAVLFSVDSLTSFRSETRLSSYDGAIKTFFQSPLFGFGTPIDPDPTDYVPAYGTHSQYLSVLFSHGIIGFVVFIVLLFSLWFVLISLRRKKRYRNFADIGIWIFISYLLNGVTTLFTTNYFALIFPWLYFAMATRSFIFLQKNNGR